MFWMYSATDLHFHFLRYSLHLFSSFYFSLSIPSSYWNAPPSTLRTFLIWTSFSPFCYKGWGTPPYLVRALPPRTLWTPRPALPQACPASLACTISRFFPLANRNAPIAPIKEEPSLSPRPSFNFFSKELSTHSVPTYLLPISFSVLSRWAPGWDSTAIKLLFSLRSKESFKHFQRTASIMF